MNSINSRYGLIFLLLIAPRSVLADVEYYTYGGFTAIVNAFTRLAVIFNNTDYLYFGFVASIIGVTAGMLIKSGMAAFGKAKASDVLGVLFMSMFGTALFFAMFAPKTTVHIYDPTANQYQSVADIPHALAFVAAGSNMLERFATDVFSSATTFERSRHANGKSLELILNLINTDPLPNSIGATKSLDSFIKGCVSPAIVNSVQYNNFDYNSILSGTNDIWAELDKVKNVDQYFTWYDDTNQRGISINCDQGFTELKTLLTNPATFTAHINNVCEASGYDPLITADIADCKGLIGEAVPFVFSASVAITPENLSAMAALGSSIYSTLSKNPGSAVMAIGNSKQMAQGFGSVIVSEGWLPIMRSATLVLILSFTPIIVLLVMTPFVFKALHMLSALFIFLAIWGTSDAVVHSVIVDNIQSFFNELKEYNGGLKGFMLAPTAIQEGIAMFGKLQSMGVIFAALMTAYYFKFSGHQFATMGEKLANDIDNTGQQTGMEVINPNGRMNTAIEHKSNAGHYNAQYQVGTELYGAGIEGNSTFHNRHNAEEIQSSGMGKLEYLEAKAQKTAGEQSGGVLSRLEQADTLGTDIGTLSQTYAKTTQDVSDANTRYQKDILEEMPGNRITQSDSLARHSNASLTGQISADIDPTIHEKTAKIGVHENIGIKEALNEITNDVVDYTKAQATTGLETTQALTTARESAVTNGETDSTFHTALIGAENTIKQDIAQSRARTAVSNDNNMSDQEALDKIAMQSTQTSMSSAKLRDSLAKSTNLTNQEISDRQAGADVKFVATPDELESLQESSSTLNSSELEIPTEASVYTAGIRLNQDGNVDEIVNPSASNTAVTTQGQQSVEIGGLNIQGQVAQIILEEGTSTVMRVIELAENESQRQAIAENLAYSSPIKRSLAENEANTISASGSGSVLGSLTKSFRASDFIQSVVGNNDQRSNSSTEPKSKTTNRALNKVKNIANTLTPEASLGARLSADAAYATQDQTFETASIDPTVIEYKRALKEAIDSRKDETLDDVEIVNQLRNRIIEIQHRDSSMSDMVFDHAELDIIKDAVPLTSKLSDIVDQTISNVTDSASSAISDAENKIEDWYDQAKDFFKVER